MSAAPPSPSPDRPSAPTWRDTLERGVLVFVGLASVVVAVVLLAQPVLTVTSLLLFLSVAVALNSARTVMVGGRFFLSRALRRRRPVWDWHSYVELGLLGIGVVAAGIALGAPFATGPTSTIAVSLLTIALVTQGLGRVVEGVGVNVPRWLRGSSVATGVIIVALVVVAVAFEGVALVGFAILVGVVLLVSGVETVVTGLHPTDPRQFVLLKLILFSAFYGLVLINWIDLFGKEVPAYGVWLILTYMAPFGVLLVFEGWESWPLATSLGLLVSLMNDVGYFFIGNLLFGFHENLGPWIAGQLGFEGTRLVTIFEAGSFHIDVTSWMMGLSIYARAVVVAVILYYWWRHPTAIVAHGVGPESGTGRHVPT